jgi:hypothetical protein
MTLYFHKHPDGEIMTFGEENLPGSIAIEVPSDWFEFALSKYIIVDGELVAREGWVDPVPGEEVPDEPETPADPE